MFDNLYEGIVLRNYIPTKQKISILDSKLGRIECMPKFKQLASRRLVPTQGSARLFNGAHILYTIKSSNFGYIISNTNILNFPNHLIHNNFIFFHHVLELCYYFLPLDQEANSIFELILALYNDSQLVKTDISKKIFLCKFFIKLGIYPNDSDQDNLFIFNLISSSFDSNVNSKDIKIICDGIQKWLISCINSHPNVHKFKTLKFLKKGFNPRLN